jgi:hypothetical protein
MLMVEFAPEGAASVIFLLAPLALGMVSFWPSARAHWSGPVPALLSLFIGLAFGWALVRSGPGYAGWPALVYARLQLILAIGSITLWKHRKGLRYREYFTSPGNRCSFRSAGTNNHTSNALFR